MGVVSVKWVGFNDPHSGLDYFRVALGSSPELSDVVSFVYVGKQTCKIWDIYVSEVDIFNKYHALHILPICLLSVFFISFFHFHF